MKIALIAAGFITALQSVRIGYSRVSSAKQ